MITVSEGIARGTNYEDQLLYFFCNTLTISHNPQGVALFSSAFSKANGYPVFKDNFREALVLFTARATTKGDWINDKDEYRPPVEEI